ncbi:MAG TPA: hypothetical protein VM911_14210 [Pyrinomonadaceae bacterium]|jgi:hypothetical protein|nr:hypothetical protein [Pyrinomonadaceae bacterium]
MSEDDATPKRPDLGELKYELLKDVEKEFLKREILKELDAAPKGDPSFFQRPGFKALAGFFQHSAVLLFLGFLLTGVIGSALTSTWQNNSWIAQQSLLAKQRILDQKYELASTVAKAVGDTHAAPSSILVFFANEDTPESRQADLPKLVEYWRQTHREWLVNHNVLLQKITVYIRDENARTNFEDIILERKQTNNSIVNLLEVMNKYKGDKFKVPDRLPIKPEELTPLLKEILAYDEKVKEARSTAQGGRPNKDSGKQIAALEEEQAIKKIKFFAGHATLHLNTANLEARNLMMIMAREIQEDSYPPSPKGFWSTLYETFGFGSDKRPPARKANLNAEANSNNLNR